MATKRRTVRSRPIRLFLFTMFAVPLVSLVVLWGFAASITVRSAISNHHYDSVSGRIDNTIAALADALPQERAESYIWLMTDRATSESSVLGARAMLNKELPASRAVLEQQLNEITGVGKAALATLLADVAQLPQIRSAVDAGTLTPAAAFQDYTNIIDAEFSYFYSVIQQNTPSQADISIGAVDAAYSVEMLGREITLVGGALADRAR
jgi:hypothetical protein